MATQIKLSLVALLSISSFGSFLYGYLKYGRKIRQLLDAGPVITNQEEIQSCLNNSYKPSFRIPFLGISFSPSAVVKIYGKVVSYGSPIRTTCVMKKGYGQRMILEIDAVVERRKSSTAEGNIVDIRQVPWGVQLPDGTLVSVNSEGAKYELETILTEDQASILVMNRKKDPFCDLILTF